MITSTQAVNLISTNIIDLIKNGKLNATYKQSNTTISFYVNDINVGVRKLTLRVSDHHPTYQHYVKSGTTLPNLTNNLSVEFYSPKYKNRKKVRNKTKTNVKRPKWATNLKQFSVHIFNYKTKLLDINDISIIYNSILNWFNESSVNQNAVFVDPFIGTEKEASHLHPISKIRENKILYQLNVDDIKHLVESVLLECFAD